VHQYLVRKGAGGGDGSAPDGDGEPPASG
jgi:hypothetical protein